MSPSPSEQLALRILRTLQSAGHTAYLAGGCVRDRLMSRPPKDFDVATSARPDQVLALFPRSQQVGVAFGVILVKQRIDNHLHQVEVATFRADGHYSDGRHPDAVRFTTAEEDARRRDFTCNGLFFDPLANNGAGQLHDFVGGQADIAAQTLRAIGNPHDRFAEDHLRMLRALRFAARLQFSIHPDTHAAIADLQPKIALISRERIGEELRMMLEHPTRAAAAALLAAFPTLFHEALGFLPPNQSTTFPVLSNLPEKTTRTTALLALLLDSTPPPHAPLLPTLRARLMLSNDETAALAWLTEKLPRLDDWEDLSKAATKRLMAHRHWPDLDALFRAIPDHADQLLPFSERTASLAEEGVAPPPFITGETLIRLGARPNPAFKSWLDALYDRQLNGELTNKDAALTAARQLLNRPPA
ncbi:MAG TPA: CCA tRNA nucleotidyltransferase [Phycisphaerae bacterium]|nr:CCA tRNA nucleotidyltransferase [Phycisphaerae bacterium]